MRNKSSVIPCMESPIRCYLNCNWNKKCLSSDKTNEVWLAKERDMWCEWFILPSNNADSFYLQSVKTNHYLSISQEDKLIASENHHDTWFMEQHPTLPGSYFIIHERNGEPLGGGDSSRFILPSSEEVELYEQEEKLSDASKNIWTIEVLTGELCFISSADSKNKYIGCDLLGKVYVTHRSRGWEVWRFVEAGEGHVKISSWSHQNKTICTDRTGNIYTVDTKQPTLPGGIEKWKVEKAPSEFNGISIQNPSTDLFLQLKDGQLQTTDTFDGSTCVWHLTSANRNRYFISSSFLEKRLVTNKTQPFIKKIMSKDVAWTVKSISDGAFAVYTEIHDRYLGSDENGDVSVSPHLQDYEKWYFQETDNGKFYIISQAHHRFLACDENHTIHTIPKLDELTIPACKWHLNTAMPPTLSGKQLYSTTIAGAAGVATGMAMIAPVTAASAGVTAAGLFSRLFLGTYIAAAGMGAGTVGKSLYNATGASPIGKESAGQLNFENESMLDDAVENRPLCAWETW